MEWLLITGQSESDPEEPAEFECEEDYWGRDELCGEDSGGVV